MKINGSSIPSLNDGRLICDTFELVADFIGRLSGNLQRHIGKTKEVFQQSSLFLSSCQISTKTNSFTKKVLSVPTATTPKTFCDKAVKASISGCSLLSSVSDLAVLTNSFKDVPSNVKTWGSLAGITGLVTSGHGAWKQVKLLSNDKDAEIKSLKTPHLISSPIQKVRTQAWLDLVTNVAFIALSIIGLLSIAFSIVFTTWIPIALSTTAIASSLIAYFHKGFHQLA